MNINSLIHRLKNDLLDRYSPDHALSLAWMVVELITLKKRVFYIMNPEYTLPIKDIAKISTIINEHLLYNKPIQYLIGSINFLDLELLTKPPILIPRPETEELCLNLINQLKKIDATYNLSILDLCTGSGCIGLSLAQAFSHATVYASDINPQALHLAQANAVKNKIHNITFIESDLYNNLPKHIKFDLIIANPPYIDKQEWQTLEPQVKDWEDFNALVAPNKGLAIIDKIAQQAQNWLKPSSYSENHLIPSLVLEIGYNQACKVKSLLETYHFNTIEIYKDYLDNDRAVYAYYN